MASLKQILNEAGISREQLDNLVDALLNAIVRDKRILIPGLGSLRLKLLKPRTVRSSILANGVCHVPAYRTMKLYVSRSVRERLNSTTMIKKRG